MGLGCAALTSNPHFPTYPHPLSVAENGAGLSSPATAIALLGKGGAGLMLLLLFMAVTSSTSAELIAVSSLITFDIYKTYIKPTATSRQLVRMSHIGIIAFAITLAVFCCILNAVSINLTWLLTILGVIVGGASVPVGLVLLWGRMSTIAACVSPYVGLAAGLAAWFATTSIRSGTITVETSGNATNAVAGNVTSWGTGAASAILLSLLFPKKYHDDSPDHIARDNEINGISVTPEAGPGLITPIERDIGAEKTAAGAPISAPWEDRAASATKPESISKTGNEIVDFLEAKQIEPMDAVLVRKSERLAILANIVFFLVAVILVPFTLFGTGYVFSKPFFRGWVVVSFIWVWCSMVICVVYPVVESRGALKAIAWGVSHDLGVLLGRRKPKMRPTNDPVTPEA